MGAIGSREGSGDKIYARTSADSMAKSVIHPKVEALGCLQDLFSSRSLQSWVNALQKQWTERVNEERGITCHHLNENNKAQKNPLQESWSMNEE